jgi:adenosylhomocysteine nucleosidase
MCLGPANRKLRRISKAREPVPEVAIIAALDREVRSLISAPGWRRTKLLETPYGCFESERAVVICAGIGAEPARRAAEEIVAKMRPRVLASAGLAGALVAQLKVGDLFIPDAIVTAGGAARVLIDAAAVRSLSSAVAVVNAGESVLVSASGVAGPEGKRLLAAQYGGQAVDMEAGPVAEVAAARGIPFVTIKAISDEYDFPMPDLQPYVTADGRFHSRSFVLNVACQPALWGTVRRLGRNAGAAAGQLAASLQRFLNLPLDRIGVPRVQTPPATATFQETTA